MIVLKLNIMWSISAILVSLFWQITGYTVIIIMFIHGYFEDYDCAQCLFFYSVVVAR